MSGIKICGSEAEVYPAVVEQQGPQHDRAFPQLGGYMQAKGR